MGIKRGFVFDETMSGTYSLYSDPHQEHPLSFSVQARADSTLRHLADGRAALTGTIEAPGIVEHGPIQGNLTMLPIRKRLIRYELEFRGDDGKPYRLEGEKRVRLGDLRRSFTELPTALYDAGGIEIGRAHLHFDLGADWLQFVTSFRPA